MSATSQNKEKFNDYEGFVEKFQTKKTTDDCYTPPEVYQQVLNWVNDNILPLQSVEIVRPFFPGCDYENHTYPQECIVIDNPPFSILSKIRRYFQSKSIKYFLFAPELSLFGRSYPSETAIVTGSSVVYANGAKIPTGFVTNLLGEEGPAILMDGEFGTRLTAASSKPTKSVKTLTYPTCVITSATLRRMAARGQKWAVSRNSCIRCSKVGNYNVFGGCYIISQRAALERAALERAALERAALERATRTNALEVLLTEEEKELQRNLF